MEIIRTRFNELCAKPSDIHEHLPTLYHYARECDSVIETGVRGCVSSWSLLYGLLDSDRKSKKRLVLNDIQECHVDTIMDASSALSDKIHVSSAWVSNLLLEIDEPVDMVFIDTYHVYGQLKRELAHFAPHTQKYLVMHDTTIDGITSESVRNKHDIPSKMLETGYSEYEITQGLWQAVEEFLADHPEWTLLERYENNNGLTVLARHY